MKYCHKCSAPWEGLNQPGSRDICLKCRADLHACLNCGFYDVSKSNQCFANVEDPVIYKDRSNFCDEFRFAERQAFPAVSAGNGPGKEKDAFDKLFKKERK